MELILIAIQFLRWVYEELRFQLYFKPLIRKVLRRNHLYFVHLRTDKQNKFFRKVVDNYRYFEFVGHGTKLSDRQKIIIAAAAAQLVLFLPDEALSYFTKIIVYPDFLSFPNYGPNA
ncbi:MAG: zinc-dependent peptidase [Cyclobacteriaceae bacterium]